MTSPRDAALLVRPLACAALLLAMGCAVETPTSHAPRPDVHAAASAPEVSVPAAAPVEPPLRDAGLPARLPPSAPRPLDTTFPRLRARAWEPPLADGYCAQRGGRDPDDCATTSIEGRALTLDGGHALSASGTVLRLSTLTYGHPPGDPPPAVSTLHLAMAPTILFGIVQLSFGADDTRVVEVYRGERPEIERFLGVVRRRVRSYRRRDEPLGCPVGERPVVMTLDVRDLDGDGSEEVLASVASQLGDDWFCRWTEVFDRRDPDVYRGAIPYGLPALEVRDVTAPDGSHTMLLAGTPDGGASQAFVAYALVNGHVARVAELEGEGTFVHRGGAWQVDLIPDWRRREAGAHGRRTFAWDGHTFVDVRTRAVTDGGVPDAAR